MQHRRGSTLLVALAVLAGFDVGARADEPIEQFIEAPVPHQYYDEALEYLDLLPTLAKVSDSVIERVGYEKGVVLYCAANRQNDPAARDAQLNRAAEYFEKFAKAYPQHDSAPAAKSQLASIAIDRGRGELEQSGQAADKSASLARARKHFETARGELTAAEKDLETSAQKLPKFVAPGETALQAQKTRATSDLLQARMLLASVDYELSKTHASQSAEAKKLLQASAKSYRKLSESYRKRSAGLVARWWEGRSYQEMGDTKRALGCYRELIDLPSSSDTAVIKIKSVRAALECLTSDGEKRYQEAIECGERWEKEAGANEADADALAIRYLTAVAYQAQSNALPDKDPNRKRLAGVGGST